MALLKYAKTRRLRRFEHVEETPQRIKFQRLTSSYPRRSMLSLIVLAGIVAYLLYYLSSV